MTADCTIRPEVITDFPAIAELTRLAFNGRHQEVDMINSIRASEEYLPELSLVAEIEGSVVGHCLLRRARLSGPPAPPVLVLGPIGVHPDRQGQGIGGKLIRTAQDRARRRGREALIVLLGFPDYYPRFGFRPAAEFGIGPDTPAAMACPIIPEVGGYAGTEIPH